MLAKLGFKNGYTLTKINGDEVTTLDKALDVYAKIRAAKKLKIDLLRRSKPLVLTIESK